MPTRSCALVVARTWVDHPGTVTVRPAGKPAADHDDVVQLQVLVGTHGHVPGQGRGVDGPNDQT